MKVIRLLLYIFFILFIFLYFVFLWLFVFLFYDVVFLMVLIVSFVFFLDNIFGFFSFDCQFFLVIYIVVVDELEYLGELSIVIDNVVCEEEVVGRVDGKGVVSEGDGVDVQGISYFFGDVVVWCQFVLGVN